VKQVINMLQSCVLTSHIGREKRQLRGVCLSVSTVPLDEILHVGYGEHTSKNE
jgi:hypothetical protein